jgi:hypothetical protein
MKKNFRKIPNIISAKLDLLQDAEILTCAIRKFSQKEIESNFVSLLGITIENKELVMQKTMIPPSRNGKYSKKNKEGYTIVRRDLPKVNKTIDCGTRYPFGNTNLAPYDLSYNRLVYQKNFIVPTDISLNIEVLDQSEQNGQIYYTIKCSVANIFTKNDTNFEGKMLFNLNLLQENFGKVDVFNSNATLNDFMRTQSVAWEIFPIGEKDIYLEKILNRFSKLTDEDKKNIEERYRFLASLNPISFILGSESMSRYFGAMFNENLVVFENLEYGNAVYVMYENWEPLSKMTRTDLLHMVNKNFDRIKHTENWKGRLGRLVASKIKVA